MAGAGSRRRRRRRGRRQGGRNGGARAGGTLAVAVLAGGVLGAGCGDFGADTATFIERLGSDTIAVETLRRTRSGFEGMVLVRSPETRLLEYRGVRSAGRMSEFDYRWRAAGTGPETPPLESGSAVWSGDSVDVTLKTADGVRTERLWAPPTTVPLPGRIPPPPLLAWSPVGTWIEIMERMRTSSGEPPHLLSLGGGIAPRAFTRPMVRWGSDSIGVRVISDWTVARLDSAGRIAAISGHGTTVAIDVERATRPIDIETLAGEYAARDARGEGFGVPSPPGRVEANVAPATLLVTYGRPSVRGRRIWGGLVPYGKVWRTGANFATHLETDHDLRIGETPVPAGRYTLWSLIEPDEAHLVVSRQTDVWGTQYEPTEDLARIPMSRDTLPEPVERLTIEIRPAGGATREGGPAAGPGPADGRDATLSLSWDRVRFSVPIRVP